jgi:DNA-binding NtrC family response regulator
MNTTHRARHVLVVDDDSSIRQVLEGRFSAVGFDVSCASSGDFALDILRQQKVDLVVSDVKMPGMTGDGLLQEIQKRWPGLPVIMLTAYGSIPHAVQAVKQGASEYLTKPFKGQELIKTAEKLMQASSVQSGGRSVSASAMQRLQELITRVAPTESPVLITGESGSGKELVARVIHDLSPRKKGPFMVVDCGATTGTLMESELFGHRKGSFTHAVHDKKGLLQEADAGTLFLDEIGNLPLEMQTKLLRFLEDRTIRRIGETRSIPVDCRILAATNADLQTMMRNGEFREDLYFRLKGFQLQVPPLRKRKADIPILVDRFVEQFCRQTKRQVPHVPDEVLEVLCNYSWPGNVRELKQVLYTAIILCTDDELTPELLQFEEAGPVDDEACNELSLEGSERRTIIRALEQSGWVQKRAAELLGISRRAMHYKVKQLGIDVSALKCQS